MLASTLATMRSNSILDGDIMAENVETTEQQPSTVHSLCGLQPVGILSVSLVLAHA
jgi:hypothetical protein